MIPTPYDAEIARLQIELRALRRKQRAARQGTTTKPKWAKRTVRKARRPADVEAYWTLLREEIGCVVTGRFDDTTIHHCHSGSMAEVGINRGGAQKVNDFLVLPLHRSVHCSGPGAIDGAVNGGVLTWEATNGRQVDFINKLIDRTGIDVWAKAGVRRPE